MTLRCLVRCSTGESRRLRPRQTAKRSVEARRVALQEKKSKSLPLQGWAMTPRGYYWGCHLWPSTKGPWTIRIQQQSLLPARQPERSKASEDRRRPRRQRRRRKLAKRGEDQGANSEDEGKRREAKTMAPTAKSKIARRFSKRRRRSHARSCE